MATRRSFVPGDTPDDTTKSGLIEQAEVNKEGGRAATQRSNEQPWRRPATRPAIKESRWTRRRKGGQSKNQPSCLATRLTTRPRACRSNEPRWTRRGGERLRKDQTSNLGGARRHARRPKSGDGRKEGGVREQATPMQYLNDSNGVLVCLRAYAPAGYDDASKNDNDPIYEAECTLLGDASASSLRDAMTGSIDDARRPVRELSDREVGDRARRGAFRSRSSHERVRTTGAGWNDGGCCWTVTFPDDADGRIDGCNSMGNDDDVSRDPVSGEDYLSSSTSGAATGPRPPARPNGTTTAHRRRRPSVDVDRDVGSAAVVPTTRMRFRMSTGRCI